MYQVNLISFNLHLSLATKLTTSYVIFVCKKIYAYVSI